MSFQQGLSGLAAAARSLDAIGNNVANASTVGFKSSSLVFADVYANSLGASLSTTVGIGTAVAAVQGNFGQGNLRSTSNPLDVAINGSGFFRLDTNGAVSYSRNGQFHLDKDGFIVNATNSKVTGYGVDAAGNILVANPSPLQVSSAQLAGDGDDGGRDRAQPRRARGGAGRRPVQHQQRGDLQQGDVAHDLRQPRQLALAVDLLRQERAPNTWTVHAALDGTVASGADRHAARSIPNGTLNTGATPLPVQRRAHDRRRCGHARRASRSTSRTRRSSAARSRSTR